MRAGMHACVRACMMEGGGGGGGVSAGEYPS